VLGAGRGQWEGGGKGRQKKGREKVSPGAVSDDADSKERGGRG